MTTPADIAALFSEALPAVTVEWHPLPSSAATVLTGEPFGQAIVISEYYGPDDPRPLMCQKHGLQRHDKNKQTGKFECKLCRSSRQNSPRFEER